MQASKRNDFDIKNRIRAELQRLNEVGLTDLKHVSKDGISTQQIHATNLGIATYKGLKRGPIRLLLCLLTSPVTAVLVLLLI